MNPSSTNWQTIMHRAAFLHERVAGGWQRLDQSSRLVQSPPPLWTRWRDLLGGEAQLAERLGWLGLDVAQGQALLQDGQVVAWLEAEQQPAWAAVLETALAQPAPFMADETAVIAPFLAIAEPVAQPHFAWCSPAAQQSLRDYLAERLREWVAPTVQQVGAYSLPALCAVYPVLGRQMATTVLHWVDEVAAFNQRVTADWSELTDYPLTDEAITAVEPNLSDPHNGGRTVWRVELADGQTLAYKPKNIDLDHAWQQLLGWLNERGLTPALTPLWTLPRPDYGWMAWVEAKPSPPTDPLYHLRTGVLLGLFHLLHATDLHEENLIHGGTHPQLVDGEMLRYPQVTGQNDPLDVLRTGALPTWFVTRQGVAEMGGLGGISTPAQLAELEAGYARLMSFVAAHEAELWADEGPLASFEQGMVRFVSRPTMAYGRLLEHLRQPAFLVSGAAFSVELDSLARAYLSSAAQKLFASLLMAEQAAMAQGDVPHFAVQIGQPDLHHSHGTVRNFFVWPPIRLPSPTEQAQQQAVIKATLGRVPYLPADAPRDLVAVARVLGELLAQQAVPVAKDGLGWMAFRPQGQGAFQQHALVGEDFYAGRAGIALFLAALYRVTGEVRWRELALAGLRGGGEGNENTAVSPDPVGRLYALTLLADWLDAPHLIEEALTLAKQPQKVKNADLIDGQAGLLLGLLKLWQVVGDEQLLAQAVSLGEELLANWQKDPHRLGGFSHGAAGIAYALTQLAEASGESRFAAQAAQAWAFQQTLYNAEERRWLDKRESSEPVYLDNWCHGSAGIGLAGQVMGEEGNTAVEITLNHLCQAYEYTLDTLCCGRCGQIDVLWELGEQAKAREMAEQLVAESVARGAFQLYDDVPAHLFNPTFFRGVAGIGYTLLRMVHPLPCVLRMG